MDARSVSAVQNYAAARSATRPEPGSGAAGAAIRSAAADFAETLRQGEQMAKASMVGDADPHMLVQALTQTELAVETAIAVRNKVVEAYQEILRMPI